MKVILFPYDIESSPISAYSELLAIDVKYYVYPSGIDLQKFSNEIFHIPDENKLKRSITDDLLDAVDAICLVDSACEIKEEEIIQVISQCTKKKKKVIIASYKYQKYKEKIKKICDENQVEIIMYDALNFMDGIEVYSDEVEEIETPVVSIMGMLPMAQKFDLQLYLRKKFMEKGYKVSQIGSKPVSELFGFHAMPSYLFTNRYTDVEKIIAFNNFVKRIEQEEKPDVIIVGIPDSIIPFSKKHNFSFGVYAFEILSAICPDFSFINLAAGEYNKEFYDEISKLCHYKFNVEADAFFISKYALMSNSIWSKELAFAMTADVGAGQEEENIFTPHDMQTDRIFHFVEEKLKRYGRFQQY